MKDSKMDLGILGVYYMHTMLRDKKCGSVFWHFVKLWVIEWEELIKDMAMHTIVYLVYWKQQVTLTGKLRFFMPCTIGFLMDF